MASRWNVRPAYASKPLLGSTLTRAAALQSAVVYAGVAAAAAAASNYGLPLLRWLHVPHITAIGAVLSLAVLLGTWGVVRTLASWRDSNARLKAQAGLAPTQRKLLGLPPTAPPRPAATPEVAPAAARAAALLATPVNPAQRLTPLTPSGLSERSHLLGGPTPGSAGRSSWTASPGGARLSPWSAGPAVATPDQLQRYLAPYSSGPGAGGAGAAAGDAFFGAGDAFFGAGAASPGAAGGGAGASPLYGYGAGGGAAAAAAAAAAAGAAGGGEGVDQGPAGSPALPIGRDAPHYRPSLLPRKAAAGAAGSAAEGLQPSADAEAGRIMREAFKMEVVQLVVWIERFREWCAAQLLGPLAALMASAHEEPNAMLRALSASSEQAPQLPAITSLLGVDVGDGGRDGLLLQAGAASAFGAAVSAAAGGAGGAAAGGGSMVGSLTLNPGASLVSQALSVLVGLRGRAGAAGGGGGPGSGGSGAGGPGGAASSSSHPGGGDVGLAVEEACSIARTLMQQLQTGQLPFGFDPQPIITALHRYAELLVVLCGRRPGELLPPAPPSYIANRVWQLAQGTCVKAFNWAGGGEHGGQPWTPDLPSDSGLLFYLFAAFLDAPGWNFPPPGSAGPESSRGAPLYLGSMRPQRSAAYSALLAFRPDKPGPEAVAVIGSNMASRSPRFSLIFGGQQITLCERDGLFKVLLMWLKYHVERRQGLVGGRFLNEAALGGLQGVLEPPDALPNIPQRVWNWWYPPNSSQ